MTAINGKTALITGAAGGIGLGIAQALAREGAHVVLADIDVPEAEKQAAALRAQGAKAIALRLDVTDQAAWASAKTEIEGAFGPVRILCNNAGVFTGAGPLETIDLKLWHWMFSVNLDSHLYAIQTFLPEMRASGEAAHIVNTVSMAGVFAAAFGGAYSASKFAALGLAETLRQEVKGSKIRVSVVCPGFVSTRLAYTSLVQKPGGHKDSDDAATEAFDAALQLGMTPEKIGNRTAQGIKANEFYIFTHGSYRPVVAEIARQQLDAFSRPADPNHHEEVAHLVAALQD